ncbi:MAG: threonine synthase [Phycisphaerales bacterium]|jgi:threonine synthase
MTCVLELRCVVCDQPCPAPASAGTCPDCQDEFAVLDVLYDMDRVAKTLTRDNLRSRTPYHWRYAELLPIEPDDAAFAWPVGGTPAQEVPRLATWMGVKRARVKDEGQNPTGSFKDRASSVGVLHALQQGADHIACASTGNAASSLAGYAARAGLPATIYVPQRAPDPKVAQLLVYGADVKKLRGTYAQAYDRCTRECNEHGWYNRNCAINPYLIEGKKTCGLEIAEQTGQDPPDWVAVSVGDGCTIAGIVKGLTQMQQLGFIEKVPRVLGVQAAGMDPIAQAFETGSLPETSDGSTCADSIDVPVPRNWRKAVREVRSCNGAFVRVSDAQITEAMLEAGKRAGIFAEPAAAATFAGVKQAVAQGQINPEADVLVVSTGSGLKDIATAMRVVGSPTEIDP